MAEEMVTIFVCRCPVQTCKSKKGGILKKTRTADEARQCIMWHLQESPYHMMPTDEAQRMGMDAPIEEWEEPAAGWAKTFPSSSSGTLASARPSTGPSVALRDNTPFVPNLPVVGSANVSVSRELLTNVVEHMQRAKRAADCATDVCKKAARAFADESAVIESNIEYIERLVRK
jgi:hypothetical protein